MENKKGTMSATGVIGSVIAGVILLYLGANLWPEFRTAANTTANTAGFPLASLFGYSGIIGILFAVAIFYGAYSIFWKK